MSHPLPADVTLIVPCYNEAENVSALVRGVRKALDGISWELVFVDDDSPDGTSSEVVREAQDDPRIRLIRRVGRRGLSSAVIEGALSSTAPVLAVMDGDLQHDEAILRDLVTPLLAGDADIAVASRHIDGGDSAGLANRWRHALSRAGIRLAQSILPVPLSDPMSGFFALRRSVFEAAIPRLTGTGFKILLEIVLSVPGRVRMIEVPFVFRPRLAGESKLSPLVMVQFLGMLIERGCKGWLPTRFVLFASIGAVGIAVNLLVAEMARLAGADFRTSQILGTACAILANFQLNNRITYLDRPLRGRRWLPGLLVFVLGSAIGAFGNVGVAQLLYDTHGHWSRSSAAGALIGVVWNYAIASTLVWR
ncbi:glycosyltransferase family 2 protein [Swaminathania salitolerans]|uniref:Dolichol monophosphate mannose synthase n=1 Tax=Swaminathania salitolerans TaxID=182838 RepID=A0A511BRE2_9PROT|nr:glycosyltransferase family 2 protein [Swaminathania salitolerans]GBQ10882.1 dolichol-phosphate mannosyltransferase [Swaminathania salitolerans LMG 21291]GEL02214.1 dolichol monophosphate mannose synthase [Swaminathania salitolerans]